jgi:hypothetical protein
MSDECDVGHNCSGTRLMQQRHKGLLATAMAILTHMSQSGLSHTLRPRASQK